eukprot:TRINITY_DN10762_c0_g1_i2.p1 TRINITY_DN10762_c0_g1~~TRINITY_DN10762_c0_g1_i2.p1  ORF type:complete len:297 (+),score=39.24 TRINITY_DN10762_c0_g1_i2:64-954(+)
MCIRDRYMGGCIFSLVFNSTSHKFMEQAKEVVKVRIEKVTLEERNADDYLFFVYCREKPIDRNQFPFRSGENCSINGLMRDETLIMQVIDNNSKRLVEESSIQLSSIPIDGSRKLAWNVKTIKAKVELRVSREVESSNSVQVQRSNESSRLLSSPSDASGDRISITLTIKEPSLNNERTEMIREEIQKKREAIVRLQEAYAAQKKTFESQLNKLVNEIAELEKLLKEKELTASISLPGNQPIIRPISQPEQVRYFKTAKGTCYHRENCRSLQISKIEITLDEAVRLGFDRCKNCLK